MRGKDISSEIASCDKRITPAYAGKSYLIEKMPQKMKDHPRLCGEKLSLINHNPSSIGSPPPMRGKVSGIQKPLETLRITPAYAGKSLLLCFGRAPVEDHPRLCGEKLPLLVCRFLTTGSPPPMRGKGLFPHGEVKVYGITPAYAGKSFSAA